MNQEAHLTQERPYQDDELSFKIIECIIRVHSTLGPGFLEKIYRNALAIELRKNGFEVELEKEIVVFYEGEEVGVHRLDILVEGKAIIETKTVEQLGKAHYAQVRSYLRATGLTLGILVNFAGVSADFRRVDIET